jgi:hypothetical protein
MNSSQTDLGAYFDELWREVNYREVREPEPLDGRCVWTAAASSSMPAP